MLYKIKLNRLLVFSFVLLSFFISREIKAGSWTKKANMPTPRVGIGTCILDDKIYVIGGYDSGGKALATVEQYDPITDTWKKLTDMKVPRAYPAVVAMDGKIYAIGGENPTGCGPNVSSIERYSPDEDRWVVLMPMPTLGITCVGAAYGKITAMGGLTAFQCKALPTRSVEQYDPQLDRWDDRAKCITERYFSACCNLNDIFYVMGGMTGDNGLDAKIIDIVEAYDPKLDKWTKRSNMKNPRALSSACSLNDKMYIIGGLIGNSRREMKVTNSMEIYDPITNEWRIGTNMSTPRAGLGVCSFNGKIYAIGGSTGVADAKTTLKWIDVLNVVEEYNAEEGKSISSHSKLATTWGKLRSIQ